MPLSEDELTDAILDGTLAKNYSRPSNQMKRGEAGHVHRVAPSLVASAQIKAGLSQSQFAELLGVSVRTLLAWEQGRRQPTGAAKSLIRIATKDPEVLHELNTETQQGK